MAEVGPAEFVRRLVLDGEVETVRPPVTRSPGAGERTGYIAELLAKAVSGWVARSGGWRRRQIATSAGGRRGRVFGSARIWDAEVWPGLDLKPGAASMELAARLVELRATPTPAPPTDATFRRLVPATMGDVVAFHLMLEPLWWMYSPEAPRASDQRVDPSARPGRPAQPRQQHRRVIHVRGRAAEAHQAAARGRGQSGGEESEEEEAAQPVVAAARSAQAILRASPLTYLLHADSFQAEYVDEGGRPGEGEAWERERLAATERLAPLVTSDRATMFGFLDDMISRAWLDAEDTRRGMPVVESGIAYMALGCAFDGLVGAAVRAGRPDALRPILRFFERYFVRHGRGSTVAQTFVDKTAEVATQAAKQRYTFSVVVMFGSGSLVASLADGLPHPTERTAAQQVFLASLRDPGGMGSDEDGVLEDLDEVDRALAALVG